MLHIQYVLKPILKDIRDTMLEKTNPLWLPEGSVRATLALGVVSTYTYVCMTTANYEALGLVAVMVMQNYFQK